MATAGTGKKISLELGGKSPGIVFDSADLDSAVESVVDAIWFNQGQVCSAGSKLLVQSTVFDKFITKLKTRLGSFRIGDSLDKTIDMAAIVDESQVKVSHLVDYLINNVISSGSPWLRLWRRPGRRGLMFSRLTAPLAASTRPPSSLGSTPPPRSSWRRFSDLCWLPCRSGVLSKNKCCKAK